MPIIRNLCIEVLIKLLTADSSHEDVGNVM